MLPFANKTDLLEALQSADQKLCNVENFLASLHAEHEKPEAREQLECLWKEHVCNEYKNDLLEAAAGGADGSRLSKFSGSSAGDDSCCGADISPAAATSVPVVPWAPAPSVFDSSGRKTDRPAGGGSHVERAPERPAGNVAAQAASAGAAGGGARAARTEVAAGGNLKETASAYAFCVRSG